MSTQFPNRVGVLSTIDYPLLPYIVQSFLDNGVEDLCVLIDSKGFGAKNWALWQERTGGAYSERVVTLGDFSGRCLPFYVVNSHNDPACAQLVDTLGISVLVNGGTPRKLSSALLNVPELGVVNVHPGVLPKYRGSSCVEWALLNGDPVGNTAHFMSEQYDEGPVIASESYLFPKSAPYRDIRLKVYREAVRLMGEAVASVLSQRLRPDRLEPQGSGTQFKPIDDEKMEMVLKLVKSGSHPSMVL